MALCCPSGMTQSTLVETCHHNLQTCLLAQMGVAECQICKQLVLQGEQEEEIVVQVKAEKKDNKPRPDKSVRRAPESFSQPRRRDTLATEAKSPPKTQSVKRGMAFSQPRGNKSYSFKDEHVVSLFKLLQKSNMLKFSEINCPEEVGKKEDPNYYLYHRMLGHLTKTATSLKMSFRC